jgi:hypothetical protein
VRAVAKRGDTLSRPAARRAGEPLSTLPLVAAVCCRAWFGAPYGNGITKVQMVTELFCPQLEYKCDYPGYQTKHEEDDQGQADEQPL